MKNLKKLAVMAGTSFVVRLRSDTLRIWQMAVITMILADCRTGLGHFGRLFRRHWHLALSLDFSISEDRFWEISRAGKFQL